jgi:hypothetical protein
MVTRQDTTKAAPDVRSHFLDLAHKLRESKKSSQMSNLRQQGFIKSADSTFPVAADRPGQYVYMTSFVNEDCSGSPFAGYAHPLDVCLGNLFNGGSYIEKVTISKYA